MYIFIFNRINESEVYASRVMVAFSLDEKFTCCWNDDDDDDACFVLDQHIVIIAIVITH